MLIHLDPSNGLPIYQQVVRQMKFAIAEKKLRAGELIPSVRELSKALAINPNTVTRAYRQLKDEQMLESVRGMGLQVCSGAVAKCQRERKTLITDRLHDALLEAGQSGLSAEEVRKLVERALQSFPTS